MGVGLVGRGLQGCNIQIIASQLDINGVYFLGDPKPKFFEMDTAINQPDCVAAFKRLIDAGEEYTPLISS